MARNLRQPAAAQSQAGYGGNRAGRGRGRINVSYVIGIDLGTTNSAMAFIAVPSGDQALESPGASMFGIPQLVNASEVSEETLLSSFLYVPGERDFPNDSDRMPLEQHTGE